MRKILIIEPDSNLLKTASSYLNKFGFDVIEVTKGSAGVQKALEFLPDIILCDSEIPDLNGYEVFNTLQQINSTAVIPFVFLIQNATDKKVRQLLNLGVDDYLQKPFQLEHLLNLIETRLKKQEKILGLADEKFNTLMEFSSDGIFIYSDGKLKYVNKKFCEIFSYGKKQLLGMNLVNIVYKDDIMMVVEKIERCIQGIHPDLQFEFRAINRNQEIVKVAMSGSSVKNRGAVSIIGNLRPVVLNNIHSKLLSSDNLTLTITKREKEVLHHICNGLTNHKVAELLHISERTVEGHRINLLKKTNCKNSATLAVFAVKYQLYQIN